MKMKRILGGVAAAAALAYILYAFLGRSHAIVLTGVVTTDDVIVSSEVQGRLEALRVREGDAVRRGELLALIQPAEWRADLSYYANSQAQAAAQVSQDEAVFRYQPPQTVDQIGQAVAERAAAEA